MKMSSGKVSPDAHPLKSYVRAHILGNHAFTAKTFRQPRFSRTSFDRIADETHSITANFNRYFPVTDTGQGKADPSLQAISLDTRPGPNQDPTLDFWCCLARSTIFAKMRFPCDFSHELRSSFAFRMRYESLIRIQSLIEIQARLVLSN